MAGRARADIPVADDLVSGMTRETRSMSVATRRHAHPIALLGMARRTRRKANMCRMVEVRPKTRYRRKRFELRRIRAGVTRRTDRMVLVLKLRHMTARARRV